MFVFRMLFFAAIIVLIMVTIVLIYYFQEKRKKILEIEKRINIILTKVKQSDCLSIGDASEMESGLVFLFQEYGIAVENDICFIKDFHLRDQMKKSYYLYRCLKSYLNGDLTFNQLKCLF